MNIRSFLHFRFFPNFRILYGLPEAREVFKNLPGPSSVIFPKYGPIPSHGNPIHPQNYEFTISGMNEVAVARHGPILKDNEATGSGKVFKYLRGFRDTIKKSKMPAEVPKSKNTVFYHIFILSDPSLLSAYAGDIILHWWLTSKQFADLIG